MFGNFIAENCSGTGSNITLLGAVYNHLVFNTKFNDGDQVSYVIEDGDGIVKVAGIGVYSSTNNTITRNDIWNWDGASYVDSPVTNITLSSSQHVIRVAVNSKQLLDWQDAATHSTLLDNPHSVTKAQVGLATVDNTPDILKPISNLMQAALDNKANTAHGLHLSSIQGQLLNNTSGINSGDNAVNSLYNDLETNAVHTGDVTGDIQLTLSPVAISGKPSGIPLTLSEELLFNQQGVLKKLTLNDLYTDIRKYPVFTADGSINNKIGFEINAGALLTGGAGPDLFAVTSGTPNSNILSLAASGMLNAPYGATFGNATGLELLINNTNFVFYDNGNYIFNYNNGSYIFGQNITVSTDILTSNKAIITEGNGLDALRINKYTPGSSDTSNTFVSYSNDVKAVGISADGKLFAELGGSIGNTSLSSSMGFFTADSSGANIGFNGFAGIHVDTLAVTVNNRLAVTGEITSEHGLVIDRTFLNNILHIVDIKKSGMTAFSVSNTGLTTAQEFEVIGTTGVDVLVVNNTATFYDDLVMDGGGIYLNGEEVHNCSAVSGLTALVGSDFTKKHAQIHFEAGTNQDALIIGSSFNNGSDESFIKIDSGGIQLGWSDLICTIVDAELLMAPGTQLGFDMCWGNDLNIAALTSRQVIILDNGTSDTPNIKFNDTLNNTNIRFDVLNETLRCFGKYRGGAHTTFMEIKAIDKKVTFFGDLVLTGLPTTAPATPNTVWRDASGNLKIT